jgi:hypothetical protein
MRVPAASASLGSVNSTKANPAAYSTEQQAVSIVAYPRNLYILLRILSALLTRRLLSNPYIGNRTAACEKLLHFGLRHAKISKAHTKHDNHLTGQLCRSFASNFKEDEMSVAMPSHLISSHLCQTEAASAWAIPRNSPGIQSTKVYFASRFHRGVSHLDDSTRRH